MVVPFLCVGIRSYIGVRGDVLYEIKKGIDIIMSIPFIQL